MATVTYWVCALTKKRRPSLNDLGMFALMCAGVVTGLYVFVGAYPEMKSGAETNGLWSGMAGVCIALVSSQKLWTMFRAAIGKKKTRPQAVGNDKDAPC